MKLAAVAVALLLAACGDPPKCSTCCSLSDAVPVCGGHVTSCEMIQGADGCIQRFAAANAQSGSPDMDDCLNSCDANE